MKTRVKVFLASIILLILIGCKDSIPFREQPTTIVEPVRARPHYHWRQGHWQWSRKKQTYVWKDGTWVNKRRHTKWVDGHWVQTSKGMQYMEGHWR